MFRFFFSLVLLAVYDANYNFIYIDVGAYEKSSDSSIFQETQFYKKMVNNSLNIPEPQQISENSTTLFPYVILGDEAFGLHTNLMRPYGGNNLSLEKKNNYRLSRARRYIECTFIEQVENFLATIECPHRTGQINSENLLCIT